MPHVSARDYWTEENTRMIAMCSDKKVCEENRQYFHKHLRHVKRNGRDEKRAARIFLSQALMKLLTQNNILQVDGQPYTRRLPKHFLKAAELWVARRGQRLLGWPKGLSSPNRFAIAGFSVAVVLSLSKMLLKGTIRIEQIYGGVVGQEAVSDIQLQKIHPSRDKPNMSGSLHKSKKNINKDLVPGNNRGIKGSTGADTTETLFPLPRGTVNNNFSLSNMNEPELLLNNAIYLDSLLEESDSGMLTYHFP
ncbi:hypothetical protein DFH11DRAFT_1594104 [Phellopilus nigrolimitatus]|nr:hypothetical protein DFH11DRAFT_1594104 [Phellopilus nigrolimitatus]